MIQMSDISPRSKRRYEIHQLLGVQKRIALLLASDGPKNIYEAWKSLSPRPSYSTTHSAFQRLVENAMVSPLPRGLSRTGLGVNQYYLNAVGFALTIAAWGGEMQLDRVAWAQRDFLPQVFGRWEHFVEQGGGELAKKSLLESVKAFLRGYDWERGCPEDEAKRKISRVFIMTPRGELTKAELVRWYEILRTDHKLASWAKRYIEGIISALVEEQEDWSYALSLLERPLG